MVSFSEMGFSQALNDAIEKIGFINPTPVQSETIPVVMSEECDIVALAQTGTGKTAAFGFPSIELTCLTLRQPQTLVLCPTRELCVQITKDLKSYAQFINELKITSVYGGANIESQIKDLKQGSHIVVGTPGRVIDLINRKVLKLGNIKRLILDEADEMLNMGFIEDIDTILETTPDDKQTWLFSATMPPEIERISKKYMKNPVEISVGRKNAGAENVKHIYYMVNAKDKYIALKRICDINPKIYGIVFCRTRQETKEIAEKLITDGYNADALHGDLSQAQRDQVMWRFRTKHLQILVATDVAARGLDVDNLTHIINYNLPDDMDIYIHRSGRTGRIGRSGVSISIIHTREKRKISMLQNIVKKEFTYCKIPNGKEICEKQLFNMIDKVERAEINPDVLPYLKPIYQKLEWLDREQLIQHFVSMEFNRFLEYYKNSEDINAQQENQKSENIKRRDGRPIEDSKSNRNERNRERKNETRKKDDRNQKPTDNRFDRGKPNDKKNSRKSDKRSEKRSENYDSNSDFVKLKINLGSRSGISPTRLIGIVNDRTRNRNITFGKIDITDSASYFEVSKQHADIVNFSLEGSKIKGIPVNVELVKKK